MIIVMEFFVHGPLPGMNEILAAAKGCGGRGYNYAKMKQHWTRATEVQARIAHRHAGGLPIADPVTMRFEWVEPNKRRDPDNFTAAKKFILDGLVASKVLPNDGWTQVQSWTDIWRVARAGEPPGVHVRIT